MLEKLIVKEADLSFGSWSRVEPLLLTGTSTLVRLESKMGLMEGSPGTLSTPYREQGPLLIEPSISNIEINLKIMRGNNVDRICEGKRLRKSK